MQLCFSIWKGTDYSLRQHHPLYPERTGIVKAKNELYMKKSGRMICASLGMAESGLQQSLMEGMVMKHDEKLRKRLHETAFHPLKLFDTL